MKYFNNINTLEELKREYKKLAMANHPDRGGDVEVMKAINAEYDEVFKRVKNTHTTKDGKTYEKETNEAPEEFKNIIDKLIKMEGVHIEVIGCFIWVSGDTKQHKDELKALKFKWHSTKKMWYLAPDGYRKKSKKSVSIEEIRSFYGVQAEFDGTSNRTEYKQVTA